MKLIGQIITVLLIISLNTFVWANTAENKYSLEQLQSDIKQVLVANSIPGISITITQKEKAIWTAGLGKANIEKDIDADINTLFRVGSITKMFTTLAVLKLVDEDRLTLEAKLQDIAPEVEYENYWSATDPIRMVHLLEHSTGWDDWHAPEFSQNDPTPVSLKEGLDFHPHSRISRWRPGTCQAYSNSGPHVAGYIVEKIVGKSFENYVEQIFFKPLGMDTTTFFKSDIFNKKGVALYTNGLPVPYWHLMGRPAGSINASAKEMESFVRFLLNRGRIGNDQIIPVALIKRMESLSGNKNGIEIGYCLSNFTTLSPPDLRAPAYFF